MDVSARHVSVRDVSVWCVRVCRSVRRLLESLLRLQPTRHVPPTRVPPVGSCRNLRPEPRHPEQRTQSHHLRHLQHPNLPESQVRQRLYWQSFLSYGLSFWLPMYCNRSHTTSELRPCLAHVFIEHYLIMKFDLGNSRRAGIWWTGDKCVLIISKCIIIIVFLDLTLLTCPIVADCHFIDKSHLHPLSKRVPYTFCT